jgi:hypothetical protein
MARVLFDSLNLINPLWNPRHILAINYKKYISKIMKVVREKLIECSILVKELFENTEDALTETNEGKIVSVDIVNTKFIRNNIKLADATTNTSGSEATRSEKKLLDLELEYKVKLDKAKRLREFVNSKIAFNFEKLLG